MDEIRFSRPQEYIITSTQDINLFLAGVGSGKTHLEGFISGYFVQNFPHVFGFIGANTYNQLTTSTMYRIREVWQDLYGWKEDRDYVVNKHPPRHFNTKYHNFDEYNGIISFKDGAVVFKGSLDNAKAHDGKEFGWALLDETKDSKEEDVKDTILTRLRKIGIYINHENQLTKDRYGELGELNRAFTPLYIATSPAKVRWINDWFELNEHSIEIQKRIYDKDDFFVAEFQDKCIVISSTYHNVENLPAGYIERIIRNNTAEGAKKLIYGNPFVKAGGEFYAEFDRTKHVREVGFKPELPIHISFDQNVVPYITATLYQTHQDGQKTLVNAFDEICLKNPNNTTEKACIEFIKRYGSQCSGLFFYGDPSGKKSDTRANEHDYKIVERVLRKYLNNSSNRVPYKHPSVLKRKGFINNALANVYSEEVEIAISSKCKNLISDFEFVKEDINGKKLKERVKDKDSGTTYEPYGHTSDSFDYFFCEAFKNLFSRHFK